MVEITIDIETIPTQDPALQAMIAESVKPPASMSVAATIEKWNIEKRPQAVLDALNDAALDGATNHIVCIGLKVGNDKAAGFTLENVADEKDMLAAFFSELSNRHYINKTVGHNHVNFDLKVIRQRAMILGVRPPEILPAFPKHWDNRVFDTMYEWTGDHRQYIKLDKLSKIFGIQGKTMDGSMVYKMWLDKNFAALTQYCLDDVELTHQVYKRMSFAA